MKVCSKCKKNLDESRFYKNKRNGLKNGLKYELFSWCKECCRKAQNERAREQRLKFPEKIRLRAKMWRDRNRLQYRKSQNDYYARKRLKVLTHYSKGIPICACCGETEIKFLSIDHIKGGGLKQAREKGYGRGGLLWWIVKNGFPRGFQILCHNCNFSKGHYGECPHKTKKEIK